MWMCVCVRVYVCRVSTFEAIAALLYELHGNEEHLQTALDNLRIKVCFCCL